ncbi:3-mercaptopyruvate sulfurtransferase [uncultured Cohaesibacter sp.]|uniref:3-mercaptopyruvate sulfurtransferase n=1 Tax=uncultured Cohaesibacter sp. TaxID=1002546 RepID=UPI002AAABA02|nr:3-mercaptopyruvate sulfurtransferase [uncultured Cohaesibacter sp.]
MAERTKWLVDTEWLEAHLDSPDVVILDGSWYLPQLERDPKAEFKQAHIPGAMFFDIDEIADLSTDLPHMLPSAELFSAELSKMGISDGQTVVVYDGLGLSSAPRLWWTFRIMGVKDVYILDGGLPKWKDEKRPVTDEIRTRAPGRFNAELDHEAVRNFDDMLKAIKDDGVEIVDARSEERWRGIAPEPRPHLSSGRMPGSKNVPFNGLVDDNGQLKDVASLKEHFVEAGVDLSKPIITSCGSGATAAILFLALDTMGQKKLSLYDGSWTEWASRDDSIIEKD